MAISYHEPAAEISTESREIHRALSTLVEELEAVDWYQQRIDVTGDEEMKDIMVHHRDEEIEHAAMILEWLRRRMDPFDSQLRTYLFSSQPVVEIEEVGQKDSDELATQPVPETIDRTDLGIRSLNR